jgi:hypothetical protein
LRFLLELGALAAFCYWGFQIGGGMVARIGLGIAVPLAVAVIWAVFVSPQAPMRLPVLLGVLLQVLVFGLAAAALAATGHRSLAWVFGVVVAVNAVLMYAWGQ